MAKNDIRQDGMCFLCKEAIAKYCDDCKGAAEEAAEREVFKEAEHNLEYELGRMTGLVRAWADRQRILNGVLPEIVEEIYRCADDIDQGFGRAS